MRAEYLSDVVPDRKMLYQQAENAMKNQNNNPRCKGIEELSLLDFLEATDGRVSNLAEKSLHWQVVTWENSNLIL